MDNSKLMEKVAATMRLQVTYKQYKVAANKLNNAKLKGSSLKLVLARTVTLNDAYIEYLCASGMYWGDLAREWPVIERLQEESRKLEAEIQYLQASYIQ